MVRGPLENEIIVVKDKYKKGDIKDKKIIIDPLKDQLITYVSKIKTSKEMYDRMTRMHEVNNLRNIIPLRNKLKDTKMKNGETIQAYFMRISKVKDQVLSIREIISNRDLEIVTLMCLTVY